MANHDDPLAVDGGREDFSSIRLTAMAGHRHEESNRGALVLGQTPFAKANG